MKKQEPRNPNLICPANAEHTMRVGIDPESNEYIVWCPRPDCIETMNKGEKARTVEDAVAALRAKHAV